MNNILLKFYDGIEFKIRVLVGIFWYFDDLINYDELMRYVDFVMY